MARRDSFVPFLCGCLTALALLTGMLPALAADPAREQEMRVLFEQVDRTHAERLAKDEQRFIDYLPALTIERLYLLMPERNPGDVPGAALFRDWVIAAEGDPLPSVLAQNVLKVGLRDILRSGNRVGGPASMCGFVPHHGLTLTDGKQRFDVLICFQCGEYQILAGEEQLLSDAFGPVSREVWDRAYAAAGLRHPGFGEPAP